ncbi:conserved hypothetical protein [Anaeromyxobacter sp. K]|uniref:hypothetical protein n=1 Tax=Anaeromyxobacter sp. (strain K) TaxID=447217 RepID=UPI00015F8899|nr:hypothetical protein [Anaeromyxobacter sp. K]ACG72194.1 conserved hypothetical protein [Anaeromyxobacter sp. K]
MRTLLLASLLAPALAAAAPGVPARAKAPPRHPDVTAQLPVQDCAECHATRSPAVVRAWEGSPHGLALVKCVVCHGSTGKDFTRTVAEARCAGCHPAQAASQVPARAGPGGCFTCHEPHALTAKGEPPHSK